MIQRAQGLGSRWGGRRTTLSAFALVAVEFALLSAWTLFVTRPYLTFDPYVIPTGKDFVLTTLGHHFWTHVRDCGTCALWNGDVRGGTPALVDPLGASLHPVVAVSTALWGVINGAKVALVVFFFLTGVGQWALARVLGLGRLARLWSAAMAIAAGHLFGAMATGGLLPIVASLASATMLLAAVIRLVQRPTRQMAVVTGGLFALLIVSGQGYIQIAFVLALPLFGVLLLGRPGHVRVVARECMRAGVLGLLLAGPFIVPFLHFWPDYGKEITANFDIAQPMRYAVLNLVIDDPAFFNSESLGKAAFPEWYIIYVGWPAVALAVVGVALLWRRGARRHTALLAAYPVLMMWLGAASLFKWLAEHRELGDTLADFSHGVRTTSLMTKLAVPPILALAAVSAERAFTLPSWRLVLRVAATRTIPARRIAFRFNLAWVAVPLALLALLQVREAGRPWLGTERIPEAEMRAVLAPLHTPELQWVQPPLGEAFWVPLALDEGLKLAFYHRPWGWTGGLDPQPVLVASRNDEPGMTKVAQLDGIAIYGAPGRNYAVVRHDDGSQTICEAHGEGGDIDVTCDSTRPGVLIVQEHSYSGWSATVNGEDRAVRSVDQWLAVDLPAGTTTVRLRYRPVDAAIGVASLGVGLLLGAWWLLRPGEAGTHAATVQVRRRVSPKRGRARPPQRRSAS
ncbi:MAG: hypothetical protein IT336_14300 [Thermomicrobiales bacterium]|nr:hypothetical protein [Thermomicrobiales bacterium]